MKFSTLVLRFILFYILCFALGVALVFFYGQWDPFAGYLLFFVPLSAGVGSIILCLINVFKPQVKTWVLLLLALPASVLGIILILLMAFLLDGVRSLT